MRKFYPLFFLIFSFLFGINGFSQRGGEPLEIQRVQPFNCSTAYNPAGCNYIPNPQFLYDPNNQNMDLAMAFYDGNMPGWGEYFMTTKLYGTPSLNSHGFPTDYVAPPLPSSLAGNNYASMFVNSSSNASQAQTSGIAAKIKKLQTNKSYSLSFFFAIKSQYLSGIFNGPNCSLKVYLTNCQDFNSLTLTDLSQSSQTIYCRTIQFPADIDWSQTLVQFTAQEEWDMIVIIPESLGIAGYGAYHFANPELVSIDDLITVSPVSSCSVNLSACGFTNSTYTWKDPNGNTIGSGNSINVQNYIPGNYSVSVTTPTVGNGNIGMSQPQNCSSNSPTFISNINISTHQSILQILSPSMTFYKRANGIDSDPTGDFTQPLNSCGTNTMCHISDEGYLNFTLESNQLNGNVWEIYKDNQLIGTNTSYPVGSAYVYPYPASYTSKTFNPHTFFIDHYSPSNYEIRLTNTILNQVKSIFFTMLPQVRLVSSCQQSAPDVIDIHVGSYHTTSSTQFIWDFSNAPSGF